ncbi:MAG: hypothetical protein ACXVA9_07855 [Bdellovibrionales bacterium]
MKLILSVLLLTVLSAQAQAVQPADCNMASVVQCPLDLSKEIIRINVHNSGRPGYCGIRILTNQNFAFGKLDEFISDLGVLLLDDLSLLTLVNEGNTVLVTDARNSKTGHLPSDFIVQLEMRTKTGETLGGLVQRTLGTSHPDGDVKLAVTQVPCPAF